LYNPEGYNENLDYSIFNYFRRDHLGSNREVWRAPWNYGSTNVAAITTQRTQYYPSGLPWASNSSDNSGIQNKKYNGKEFVEMHGLDEYDSEARWYYPAIGRTPTQDPLSEAKPWLSPYMWCSGNLVNRTDPTGMFDVIPLPGVTVTTPDLSNNNNNNNFNFAFQQLLNNANRNIPQIPSITSPTPTFNLPTNTNANNVVTVQQSKPKDKNISETLKKVDAMIQLLGITDGSVTVVEKAIKGVPTVVILFKDGAALANLASTLSKFKGALGPAAFGLNGAADFFKLSLGTMNGQDFTTDMVINGLSLAVPEIGVVWFLLQNISAKNYPQNIPYYQNSVCPVDNTNVIVPNLNH